MANQVEKSEVNNDVKNWYFTFGGGHPHPYGYVKIQGTFSEARAEMVRRHGVKWAFQYDDKGFEGQVEKYGLYEVK